MIAFLIVAATVLSYAVAWIINVPLLVPILNTVASFPFMVAALRRGDLRLAIARMLLWALTMSVCATLMSYARPVETDALFVRGESYRLEMFSWVLTGRGAEDNPSEFIPQQAVHAAVFSALAIVTGGIAAMPMGAVLMNYMGHYVGSLAGKSRRPALTMMLAWHPWAVIRVISFVAIGVVLAVPLLSRVFVFRIEWRTARRLLAWAGAGLVVDVALKAMMAPTWQRLLLRVVGW